MNEILASALSQGLGYGLFVVFFYYTLKKQEERDKKSEEREVRYQNIIADLTNKFNIVELVQNDVKEIKNHIFKN